MPLILNRWLILLALILSIIVWLGISALTTNAIFALVKSNFDFTRVFDSISLKTLGIAFMWSVLIVTWMMMSRSISVQSFIFGTCVVAVWGFILNALTAFSIHHLWGIKWAVILLPIIIWILEFAVAVWLLGLTNQFLSFRPKFQRLLLSTITGLACLIATKVLMLGFSPGIFIRM